MPCLMIRELNVATPFHLSFLSNLVIDCPNNTYGSVTPITSRGPDRLVSREEGLKQVTLFGKLPCLVGQSSKPE
jgi:hypothetical protein